MGTGSPRMGNARRRKCLPMLQRGGQAVASCSHRISRAGVILSTLNGPA